MRLFRTEKSRKADNKIIEEQNHKYMNIYEYKALLDSDKIFRDREKQRLLLLRREAHNNFNTQSLCNLILSYIYDLDFRAVFNQNNKNI